MSLTCYKSGCGHEHKGHFLATLFLCVLQALYRTPFISRTPNKDQKVEQCFFCQFVQVLCLKNVHELMVVRFVHAAV